MTDISAAKTATAAVGGPVASGLVSIFGVFAMLQGSLAALGLFGGVAGLFWSDAINEPVKWLRFAQIGALLGLATLLGAAGAGTLADIGLIALHRFGFDIGDTEIQDVVAAIVIGFATTSMLGKVIEAGQAALRRKSAVAGRRK